MTTPATIREAAAALRGGGISSVELTREALRRVARLDPHVGAFILVTEDAALAAAQRADADFAAGVDQGPLQGIPFALKDMLATKDAPTTAGSRIHEHGWGDGDDAVVTARIRAAGAALMGKLSLFEFALTPPDPESGFPIARNPWDLERTPGGSSSGAGVAVATGMILGALGTDTGGSVRIPAAMSGLSGLKVTYGRVPKWGCVPLAPSLDTIGPMARSAYDCALILQEIAGTDARDPVAADVPVDDYTATIEDGVRGLRIGVPVEYYFDHPELDPEMKTATEQVIDVLRDQGAEIDEVRLPHVAEAQAAHMLTMVTEALASHWADIASPKWSDYGAATRMFIARGALYSAADYVQAQRFRSYFAKEIAQVMASIDVLITPAFAEPAQVPGNRGRAQRGTPPGYNSPFNLLGYPALAIPSGFTKTGLPLSAQIVGAPFDEATVLRVGHAYQLATDWHLAVPPIVEAAVSA